MAKWAKKTDWVLILRIIDNTMYELAENKPVTAYKMLVRLKEIIGGQPNAKP